MGVSSLNERERLLYEVWLFDTEQRNGGVSQYFYNFGLEQWHSLCGHAKLLLPSFAPFAEHVNQVIGRSQDAYQAVIDSGGDLDTLYEESQIHLIAALKLMMIHDDQ